MDDMTNLDGRSLPTGSPILAMHGRYEAVGAAFDRLDGETSAAGTISTRDTRSGLGVRYSDVKKRLLAEQDMLRVAILMVPPEDMTDAMVLTFHAANLYDMVRPDAGGSERREEREAVGVALDQILNFLASTVPQDHERLGPAFQGVVGHVFHKGQLIDGNVEGQELDKPGDDATEHWSRGLLAYEMARTAVEAADSAVIGEPAFDALVDEQTAALKALLAIPAPDNAALAKKLEIIDEEGWHERPEAWPQIITDARRLGPA